MPGVTANQEERGEPNEQRPPAEPKKQEDANQRQKDFAVAAQLKMQGVLRNPQHFVPVQTRGCDLDITEALLEDFYRYKETLCPQRLRALYTKYYYKPLQRRKQLKKRQRGPKLTFTPKGPK